MIRSVLDNQHFATWAEYWYGMTSFYETADLVERCVRYPADYRRLRMITRQYAMHRQRLQALTTLTDVEKWLNQEHLALFNVPMNYLDNRRRPIAPLEFKFTNVVEDRHIDTIHRLDVFTEEPIKGKGWSGSLIVKIVTNPRYDITALRFALGSYGIYVTEVEYSPIQGASAYELTFSMLRRDFKLKGFREEDWLDLDTLDDDDRFDQLSVKELEQLERDELFDDDIQWRNMGFEHDFE